MKMPKHDCGPIMGSKEDAVKKEYGHRMDVMRANHAKQVKEFREELAKVKAERDEAVKYRAELADYLLATCGKYCFGDHDTVPCSWRDSNGICKLRE